MPSRTLRKEWARKAATKGSPAPVVTAVEDVVVEAVVVEDVVVEDVVVEPVEADDGDDDAEPNSDG